MVLSARKPAFSASAHRGRATVWVGFWCILFCLVSGKTPVQAQSEEQVKQLREAKSLFEAGLITPQIYEERQRAILKMEAANSKAGAQAPSLLLTKLGQGYWKLFYSPLGTRDFALHDGVFKFEVQNGKVLAARFKDNFDDEPGRPILLPLENDSPAAQSLTIKFNGNQSGLPTKLVIALDAGGNPVVTSDDALTSQYLEPAGTVLRNESWFRHITLGKDLVTLVDDLGDPDEIWDTNGAAVSTGGGNKVFVYYNFVEVPKTTVDDFGFTLRPLLLKVRPVDADAGKYTPIEGFDYMVDRWIHLPQAMYEKTPEESCVYQPELKEEWDKLVVRRRADRGPGYVPKCRIPIKDGGVLRGKYPHADR